MTGPDALLCDVDGVLRHWEPEGMVGVDRAHGMPDGTLAAYAFAPVRLLPAITGELDDVEWRAGIAADLAGDGLVSPATAETVIRDWRAVGARVDSEVVALLTDVRRRLPVVLVTNQTTSFERELDELGLTDLPTAVVNSARVGVAKPDPAIYEHAAGVAGVAPSRCLFVDDGAANVEAAERVGMRGFHYTGPADVSALRTALGADSDEEVPA